MKRALAAKRLMTSPNVKKRKRAGAGGPSLRDNPAWCDGSILVSSPFLLAETLTCGQAFRWNRVGENSGGALWAGVIHHRVYVLQQRDIDANSSLLLYKCAGETANHYATSPKPPLTGSPRHKHYQLYSSGGHEAVLQNYFRLEWCTNKLWREWTTTDSANEHHPLMGHFVRTAAQFKGVRILRQDPLECLARLYSMCMTLSLRNNNIQRITQMLNALCEEFGHPIPLSMDWRSFFLPEVEETPAPSFFSFPSITALAAIEEDALRKIGFGYRARYIPRAAGDILAKNDADFGEGVDWLYNLRLPSLTADRSQSELCSLLGVGPKVGDCVSLFSLDKLGAIPVDTHVWQIAKRYVPALQNPTSKTLTPRLYKNIGAAFAEVFGPTCGWAHSLLFAVELPTFQKRGTPAKKGRKRKG